MLSKSLLIPLFIVNLFLLLKIILFKFGPVSMMTLIDQAKRTYEQPEIILNRWEWANLVPFDTISVSVGRQLSLSQFMNLYGNIAIFIPTGIIISLIVKKRWSLSIIISFGISLLLECMQLFLAMGSFDVDDLILNTSGGLIGAGIVVIGSLLVRKLFHFGKVQEVN
ncbi:VanZ family protein [Paenibacillus endoradicis]|uniref:VanZ family protein n=1 Tax=Paenibacillus endoradicis TaxID=2972487 RepID=UPI002158AC60|nr:VanZ family protein [Paenibacillus endoradicis]MCR8659623.1 VanZ family protein [Paenibacillus endoradicis]